MDTKQVGGQHYVDMKVQPWTVMEGIMTAEEFRGFLKGNIIKYAMRAGRKIGSDDLGKLIHYAEKLQDTQLPPPAAAPAPDGLPYDPRIPGAAADWWIRHLAEKQAADA